MLSSATVERRVLRAGTFDLVAELELRDSRIDDLLQRGNAFIDVASPAGLEGLTSAQQARLALLLRRALYHCDRIADLAANPPCEPIAEDHYALIPTGVWAQPGPLYPEDLRDRDPFANPGARAAQLAYIRLLCPRDAALLFYLVTALGASFSFARRIYESSDPAAVSNEPPCEVVPFLPLPGVAWDLFFLLPAESSHLRTEDSGDPKATARSSRASVANLGVFCSGSASPYLKSAFSGTAPTSCGRTYAVAAVR